MLKKIKITAILFSTIIVSCGKEKKEDIIKQSPVQLCEKRGLGFEFVDGSCINMRSDFNTVSPCKNTTSITNICLTQYVIEYSDDYQKDHNTKRGYLSGKIIIPSISESTFKIDMTLQVESPSPKSIAENEIPVSIFYKINNRLRLSSLSFSTDTKKEENSTVETSIQEELQSSKKFQQYLSKALQFLIKNQRDKILSCKPNYVESCALEKIPNNLAEKRLKQALDCNFITEDKYDLYMKEQDGTQRDKIIFPTLIDKSSSSIIDISHYLSSCDTIDKTKMCFTFCNPNPSLFAFPF